MANIGELTASLGLNNKQFLAGIALSQTSMLGLSKNLSKLAIPALAVAGVIGLAKGMAGATRAAAKLEKGMANVSTLVSKTKGEMDVLTDSVVDMSSEVLKSSEDLSAGLYQVFSAGITDSAEAMDVLRVSAIAATAGLSTTLTSVDAITTVLNAYGLEAKEATDISDLMFQTVRLGKTTYDQLAQSIGTVISPAASLGIELDELFASLATLTKGGLNTMRATTALRATFLAIIKPGDTAKKVAKQLGIEWNTAAIQSKGLIGFLNELKEVTGGNTETISQLFPNVRALNAVLALTGKQSEELNRVFGEMKDRVGSTDVAFSKQADTFEAKSEKMSIAIEKMSIAFGKLVLPVVAPIIEDITESLEGLVNIQGKLALENATNELRNLGEEIKFLEGLKSRALGLSLSELGTVAASEGKRLEDLRERYSLLTERVILLADVASGGKVAQDAFNESMSAAQKDINGIITGMDILTDKTNDFSLSLTSVGKTLPSVFDEEQFKKIITLTEEQNALADELIAKSAKIGKTEKQQFEISVAGIEDALSDAQFTEFTDREKQTIAAITALRQEFRDSEKLAEFQAENERIARLVRAEERKTKIRQNFLKQFEDVGLSELEILENQQKKALAIADKEGFDSLKITEFYAKKRTEIKQKELEKQLSAAGTIATATGDIAGNLNELLISQGKEGSRELFLIAKAAAIANAIVSTAVGVTRALELGVPLGPPAAALVAAAGATQVALIASTALAKGGLTQGPTLALLGDNPSGQEAVLPIERGVSPIIERSVRNVVGEGKTQPSVAVIVVDDIREIEAVAANVVSKMGEDTVVRVLNKRNRRTTLGENTVMAQF